MVAMAPEVAGRIVELPVADNKYVRKGDLLLVIDPTNYSIAVSQAEAAVQQQQAWRFETLAKQGSGSVQNAQQFTSQMHQQEAAVHTGQENLNLAQRQVE